MARESNISAFLDLESFLDAAPEKTRRAASLAMNDVIGGPRGLGVYRNAISKQINFPAGYLDDTRFGLDRRSTPDNLVTSLVARQRPTSLARFATSGVVGGKGGVSVKVKAKGGSKRFKSGFLVRLPGGIDGSNIGLAVRLSPGQQLNKRDQSNMVYLDKNVVLLYGPSIDQVLNTSVAEAETPEVIDNVATEFYRQFARLTSG